MSDEILVLAKNRFGRLVLADAAADGRRSASSSYGSAVERGQSRATQEADRAAASAGAQYGGTAQRHGRIAAGGFRNAARRQGSAAFMCRTCRSRFPIRAFSASWAWTIAPRCVWAWMYLRSFDRVSIDFANRRVRFRDAGRRATQSDEKGLRPFRGGRCNWRRRASISADGSPFVRRPRISRL